MVKRPLPLGLDVYGKENNLKFRIGNFEFEIKHFKYQHSFQTFILLAISNPKSEISNPKFPPTTQTPALQNKISSTIYLLFAYTICKALRNG
jgi:hypothetical protein